MSKDKWPQKEEVNKLFIGVDIQKNGVTYSDNVKKHFFRQFMDDKISCTEYKKLCADEEIRSWTENDMGKIPNVDYPCRHDFKKKENIFQKVVKWWRS